MKILFSVALFLGSLCLAFTQTCPSSIFAEFVSSRAEAVTAIGPNGISEYGDFRVKFKITALSKDIYLDRGITFSSASPVPDSGFNWFLTPNSSGLIQDSTSTVLSWGSKVTPLFFKISKGHTEVFEFRTFIIPQTTGLYGVSLDYLNWTKSPCGKNPANFLALRGFDTCSIFLQAIPEPSTLAFGAIGIGSLFLFRRKEC